MKVLSPHSQNEIKLNFSDAYFLTNRKGRVNTSLLNHLPLQLRHDESVFIIDPITTSISRLKNKQKREAQAGERMTKRDIVHKYYETKTTFHSVLM